MRPLIGLIIASVACLAASAQSLPEKPATLSSTQLVKIERLKTGGPDQAPDGLSFCFLVGRTSIAPHKFAIKETRDFTVSKQSYRQLTQASLGRVFEPRITVQDAPKYASTHPELASVLAAAPEKSLVVLVAISGSSLEAGSEVEVVLHAGFGRTADKPEAEDLLFRTKVPSE